MGSFLDLDICRTYGWNMRYSTAQGLILLVTLAGCMDPLHDYNECVDIETARCDRRSQCDKSGNETFEGNFKNFDGETCVAYAKEHCRTRELGQELKAHDDLDKCIAAIEQFDCSKLRRNMDETESIPACWFIDRVPVEEEQDGGADGG